MALRTPCFRTSGLENSERVICHLKPPSLQSFVMPGPGHRYSSPFPSKNRVSGDPALNASHGAGDQRLATAHIIKRHGLRAVGLSEQGPDGVRKGSSSVQGVTHGKGHEVEQVYWAGRTLTWRGAPSPFWRRQPQPKVCQDVLGHHWLGAVSRSHTHLVGP